MSSEEKKHKIVVALKNHSVIIIPGLQKHRAKCYCGFTSQGSAVWVKRDVLFHQAEKVMESLYGVEAEIVDEENRDSES